MSTCVVLLPVVVLSEETKLKRRVEAVDVDADGDGSSVAVSVDWC